MVKRYSVSLGVGAMGTVVLLFIMQAVISTEESGLNEAKGGKILDFVRLQEDEELIVKQRKHTTPTPPPPALVLSIRIMEFAISIGVMDGVITICEMYVGITIV